MAKENKAPKGADTIKAEKLLQEEWDFVSAKAESPEEKISFVEDSQHKSSENWYNILEIASSCKKETTMLRRGTLAA